jgi:hypothetical protein
MANPVHESHTFIEFFMEAVEYKFESEQAGRPIFKEIPFFRITVPGDRNNVTEGKVTEYHKKRYPKAWAAFQAGQAQGVTGTPLETWPQITRSQVKEAKYYEIHTVEQLSQLADIHCQRLGMGWTDLRQKAKDYIDLAAGTAHQTAQAAENERLRQEMEAMRAQIAEISANAEKNKPGRPKKETVEA